VQRGLTLLELLLVMAVMGVVLGLGLGAFTALRAPDDYALSVVRSTLRAASNQALTRGARTRVVLVREGEAEESALVPQVLFTAGTWHFESEALDGAFGVGGTTTNGRIADDGYIGRALSLGLPGSEARFDVERDPAFDPAEGFVIELAVRASENEEPSGHVLDLGRVVGLDLMPDGAVRGWFAPLFPGGTAPNGDAAINSFLFVETPPGVVRPGRWARLRLAYDRQSLSIDVDGRPYERLATDLPVRPVAGLLRLSNAERQGFRGDVDKLVTAFYSSAEAVPLPEDVSFPANAPGEIVFDASGGLDAGAHVTDVEVPVRFLDTNDSSHEARVLVNLQGTVQ